jgi:inward rectifier potassium channel
MGSAVSEKRTLLRLPSIVNRDGTIDVLRVGLKKSLLHDLYHRLIGTTWPRFLMAIVAFYLLSNSFFGTLYFLDQGGVENARPGSWMDAFAFSVQTMATIGYGKMAPVSVLTHVLVTFESIFGLMTTAVMTGLFFSKFARPTARILFSQVAVVMVRDGKKSLVFRVANERGNQVVEAQLRLWLFRTETTPEGEQMRRFYELPLVRSFSPVFAMTWSAQHILDEKSLLLGATKETLEEEAAELVVTFMGIDNTLAQTVHARHGYRAKDVRFGARFVDILSTDQEGRRIIDFRPFHDTVQEPPQP